MIWKPTRKLLDYGDTQKPKQLTITWCKSVIACDDVCLHNAQYFSKIF